MKNILALFLLTGCLSQQIGKYEINDCGRYVHDSDIGIEILDKSSEAYEVKISLLKEGYLFEKNGKTVIRKWYRIEDIDTYTYKINCEE